MEKNTAEKIQAFLDSDLEKVDTLIEKCPDRIPVMVLVEFLKMDQNSVRAAIEAGAFGFAWRKDGKTNKAYCVPTAQFVRWYLNTGMLEGVYRRGQA